ncbi:hypothetical protein C0J52_22688 [Blattella germanica]|nr:hypothetical protein C0J52_22688 [Blattella germanica]
MLQFLREEDKVIRRDFCIDLLRHNEDDDGFCERIIFSDESTFHLSHVRDSPKINVFCAVSHTKMYGPFFFAEPTVNDGAPPHWHTDVRDYLDEVLPHRWIVRATADNNGLAFWPPRSPDHTPCDSFLWGFVKYRVFVPPLPLKLDDLKQRIRQDVASVDADMLQRVWDELDYRRDVPVCNWRSPY